MALQRLTRGDLKPVAQFAHIQHRRAIAQKAEAAHLAAEEGKARRRFEQERLRRERDRRTREEYLARIEREWKRAEEERKKEQVKQVKLKGYGGLSSRISVDQIGWWVQVQSRGTLCQ